MRVDELRQQHVLVVGAGVTGLSVMRFLQRHDVAFDVADEHDITTLPTEWSTGRQVYPRFDAEVFRAVDVLILSPGIPRALPAVQAAIDAGVAVIGDIELYACATRTPVIAVTGSNGKSTVVSWLAHVLEHCGVAVALGGNIGRPALDCLDDPAALHVLELSSYQLESTTRLAPLVATVLNVSEDHMDRYRSIEHYAETKRRIYADAQCRVVNRDDSRSLPDEADGITTIGFALNAFDAADYRIASGTDPDTTMLCHHDDPWLAAGELQMPGRHNVANALAILALLEPLSLDRASVLAGLAGFSGLPHRTELVASKDGVRWFNDSKGTNVDACIKAVEAMPGPVVLIAGGQGKGADFSVLRPVVERHVKLLLLLGEDREQIERALRGATRTELVETLQQAVSRAAAAAGEGDAVLLSPACASFDMFRDFNDRGCQFRQAVEAIAA